MRVELRSSGGTPCENCGSHELLHVDESPLTLDLTHALEVEMLRREVRLAQVFKDHLATVEHEYAATLVNKTQKALLERGVLIREMEDLLHEMTLDVSRWRVFKAHRERRFKERVEAGLVGLQDLTRYPFSEPPKETVDA